MDREAFSQYANDRSRHGAPLARGFDGAAGGSACGDLIRISVALDDGRIARLRFAADGCAAARAAGAAVAELADGEQLLDAALIGPDQVAAAFGGIGAQGRHAVELAADALQRALGAAAGSSISLAAAPASGERVLVALSGGVDSAVAALVERERGAEVVAVTLKLWSDRRTDAAKSCCSPLAVLGARELAHSLGIPHVTLDLEPRFRAAVVGGFIDGYRAGRTPNPCVICNGELRIDAMLALADRLGAAALATGHYARLVDDGEGPLLTAAADPAKDQTYMLSGLAPTSLARLRFPLAELTKPQVRELASSAGLAVASKAESQDLCFLAGEGKRAFLARHGGLGPRVGEIVDRAGRRLGSHRGHHEFTVGQRRGLGVGSREPLYVLATDAATNTVVAGGREQLATTRVPVREATLHRPGGRVDRVRLRYHSRPLACALPGVEAGDHAELELELGEPAYGVAPGQTACLMSGDVVVGRATIA
ncbi:MAG: tRNA-uridine 2-sulfurtransferase [Solirubrobacterales bacterium]|jgi:tRNA-specific 2-thiouridylase|nr:tRNA-uridine 2-sulfurtransferase [Solirubrobacterales bacterium]